MQHRVLLTGGGSGGHVFPALAVGEELESRGWTVSFAGRPASMEERLVTARGIDFRGLPSRAVLGRSLAERAGALLTLIAAAGKARRLLRSLRSSVVVATGGYVSVPAALAARSLGIPLLLIEPNARAGLANRWLSRLARSAAIAFEEAAQDLHCAGVLTGVPVRRAIHSVAAERPPMPPMQLLVVGGSQGAQSINRLLPAALEGLSEAELEHLRVLHQAGHGKVEETKRAYAAVRAQVEVVEFIDDIAAAFGRSHLVLSRAGAVTLAEICAAARPALLFPIAAVSSHQVENASVLEKAGAARSYSGAEPREVTVLLRELLVGERLGEMAAAARRLARPGAAAEIADLAETLEAAA